MINDVPGRETPELPPVPELTGNPGIKLNARVRLRRPQTGLA
jgi:hypothetical protein